MNKKLISLAAACATLVLALTLMAGCGGPSTLEEYVSANPDEWAEVESTMAAVNTGEYSEITLNVEDNEVTQIMVYAATYNADEVTTLKSYFSTSGADIVKSIESMIPDIEAATGVSGIVWTIEFQNGDGTTIWSGTTAQSAAA